MAENEQEHARSPKQAADEDERPAAETIRASRRRQGDDERGHDDQSLKRVCGSDRRVDAAVKEDVTEVIEDEALQPD